VSEARTTAPRDRFDPPLLRVRWTTSAPLSRETFLGEVRARSGWESARVESVLWHGGVFVGGRPHAGATLPEAIAANTRVDLYAFAWEPEPIAIDAARILHDAADWLAVDKPAWMTTQRSRASERLSVEASLRAFAGEPGLVAVHRLDRETSGVLVFAKTRGAATRLGRAFAEGRVHKRYLARVAPVPRERSWEVSGFLGRVLDPQRYRFALRDAEAPGFRASHTRFTRLDDDGASARVACEPVTGRSHQIRVHLAASGTPIVGDALYGGVAGERTLLHASEVALPESEGAPLLVAPAPASLGA
jgi:RluA family pseudouridine synthase